MSQPCAPRGACAAAMTLGMTMMKGRRMENAKSITMARETCAWRVRLRARGSDATFLRIARI
jgi:hypothetical protein